jgi:hypothetical protein
MTSKADDEGTQVEEILIKLETQNDEIRELTA